jgi:hypothetical protein
VGRERSGSALCRLRRAVGFARSASPLLARVCEHDRDKRRRLLGRGHWGGDQAS